LVDFNYDSAEASTGITLFMYSEFTVSQLSIHSSIKVNARKTNGTAFRHLDVAWVHNAKST